MNKKKLGDKNNNKDQKTTTIQLLNVKKIGE